MANIREIVIGSSPDQPVLVFKQCVDLARFEGGEEQGRDCPLGRFLTALPGSLPDLLLAGYVSTTKLMEVQIHGDLVRASDGIGLRAFAIGDRGVAEQAKLFEPEHLTALIDVAVIWRLASVVVGQKYLADISATLKSIEKDVGAIYQFQRGQQASKIESAYEYLRQAECALLHGERESAVRHRLEAVEAEMDGIQRHLAELFDARLDTRIKEETLFGYADMVTGFEEKLQDLQRLLHEHRLAGLNRHGALQILSAFPGGHALKSARAQAINEAADRNKSMCQSLKLVMFYEVSQWSGKLEAFVTNVSEGGFGQGLTRWLEDFQPSAKPAINERRSTGTETPMLDAIKLAAWLVIDQIVATELQSAANLNRVCRSINGLNSGETTRCLVEWDESGPVRIRKIVGLSKVELSAKGFA